MEPSVCMKRPTSSHEGKQAPCLDTDVSMVLANLGKAKVDLLKKALKQMKRVSSGCTGTGMADIVTCALAKALDVKCDIDFSCEAKGFKRDFFMNVVHPNLTQKVSCMFEEMADLSAGVAKCSVHNRQCAVKRGSDSFWCGFSCKDILRQSARHKKANLLRNCISTSGGRFRRRSAMRTWRAPRAAVEADQ